MLRFKNATFANYKIQLNIRYMNKYIYILLVTLFGGCTENPKTEKYQYNRDNIINVKDKIKEIKIDSLTLNTSCSLYIINNYLLIVDYKSYDYLISIFDKNNFHYITSTAYIGQGPGEIANIGYIGIDNIHRQFNVSDYGKQAIFSYNLDSILTTPSYIPSKKLDIYGDKVLEQYKYLNDTICIGLIFEPISVSDFKLSVGTQNINTGEFRLMPYTHPDIEKKRVSFDASVKDNIYVECYQGQNLMTICTLDGLLKYNIYGGKNWKDNQGKRYVEYFQQVTLASDKIIALYLNDNGYVKDPVRGIVGNLATKFLVFDINGNYIATLETNYPICHFCYDEENNRIILNMNDDMQFGYLDLDGLVDISE